MKKILLAVLVFTGVSVFSQEEIDPKKQEETKTNKKEVFIGVKLQVGQIATFGLDAEFNGKFNKKQYYESKVAFISSSAVSYDFENYSTIGTGFELGYGNRSYLQKGKESKGFYFENFLTYGKIDFDGNYITNQISGTYSYWSLFNSNIGYKARAGNFVFEPAIGGQWNWEVKGKGQVDNKNIDNLFFRGSFKIAYTF